MCVYTYICIIYIYCTVPWCQHTPNLLSPEPGAEVGPLDRASQGEAPRLASSGAAGGHVSCCSRESWWIHTILYL